MVTNQASMTGPKKRPIVPVPKRWARNSASKITTVSGTTTGVSEGAATSSPSMALSTEMAGVMAPSP